MLDISIIVAYFLLTFFVAFFSARILKAQNNSQNYFLAGRSLPWFLVGTSLFASNIGSEHLIGLSGSGFSSGILVAHYEILAGIILLLLGWFFAPVYLRSKISTTPEFLEKRYNKYARFYLTFISVLGYVLTKISVSVYSAGVIFEALGLNFWVGALFIVGATGLYTILGGLFAVVYTDMVQTFVLLAGSIALSFFGIFKLGGVCSFLSDVPAVFLDFWQPASDPVYPWTGILLGAPILGIWYWCTDQFIVQRVISAQNISQARLGTIFAGFLKMLPLFLFVLPGIVAFVLAKKELITVNTPDAALPTLMKSVLPEGFFGLVIAGLFAALMSSLSSVFNACSSLITFDVFKRLFPNSSEKKLVTVGQISTALLVFLGVLWIPFINLLSAQVFIYLQTVQAYIAPPITAVFLLGIIFPYISGKSALITLLMGFFLGALRFVAEFFPESIPGELSWFVEMHFLHFAFFLFLVSIGSLFLFTYLFKEKGLVPPEYTYHVKYLKAPKKEVFLSLLLLGTVGVLWTFFSG